MSTQFRILLSRFLTRFGDQAWDFAVPLVLMEIFPGNMKLIALIYLFSKLAQIIVGPAISRRIDNSKRVSIYKLGIGSQTVAMALMWIVVTSLIIDQTENIPLGVFQITFLFITFSLFSAISNLGSSLMDIAVGFDLAVDVLPANELTTFNSRLKRLDLITEVTAPIFTGLIFSLFTKSALWGFSIIALLNLLTFLPEYFLLKTTQLSPNYKEKVVVTNVAGPNFIETFIQSLKRLKNEPYALIIISYAFLWLSALSPHGVLLTSYLKDGTKLSEMEIGLFRGFGAIFGLIPTFLFAQMKSKFSLVQTSKIFIWFQTICVICCLISFFCAQNIYVFLVLILLSRIGLYGFSIGETEIRQHLIPLNLRGEVNGIANSTTSMATLILFAFASIFGSIAQFGIMVGFSVLSVVASLVVFLKFEKERRL